jgi:hypothetical protein
MHHIPVAKERLVGATAVAVNGEEISSQQQQQQQENPSIADGTVDEFLWQLRLNVFEKAKTVASVCTSGTLCTVSSHEGMEGAPFGSFVDYVLDDRGNPVLLMNEMSMHTINIEQNALKGTEQNSISTDGTCSPLVTLFTQLSDNAAGGGSNNAPQGQDVSRCSFTCRVEKIPKDAPDMNTIRMRYSLTHTYADQVMDSPKFAFYRLLPEKIYYVGGFGVMAKWVDVDDYQDAAPDILAKDASAIGKVGRYSGHQCRSIGDGCSCYPTTRNTTQQAIYGRIPSGIPHTSHFRRRRQVGNPESLSRGLGEGQWCRLG